MRILVTGAAGQLGTDVVRHLSGSHHEVLAVDQAEVDLADRDGVLGVLTSWGPELVLHGGALTAVDACEADVDTAFAVNAMGTRWVADGARRVGAHVVYVSTDYVFDGTKEGAYVEWDDPNPQSVYGRSKLAGEREIDPGWTVARTSWVCGAAGNNMVRTILRLAEGDGPMRFVDDQVGCPTFTADLAPRLVQLGVSRMPGVFHLTNSGAVSWYRFAQQVLAAAGHDPARVEPISTAELDPPRPAPRPANSVLDNAAWRAHGLAEPRDFREPLAELVSVLS